MAEGHWGSGLPSSGPFGPRQGSLGESLFSSAGGADLVNQLQQVARQQRQCLKEKQKLKRVEKLLRT